MKKGTTDDLQTAIRLDATCVRKVQQGSRKEFGALYDRWFDRCFDLARQICRDNSRARDVCQDAFIKAYRSIDSLEQPESFGGWLLRIVRNTALNEVRKSAKTSPVDAAQLGAIEALAVAQGESNRSGPVGFSFSGNVSGLDDPAGNAESEELKELVWTSLAALPERDSTSLSLALRYGLSSADIAEVLAVEPNTASQIMSRAKQRLQSAVESNTLWRGGKPRCSELQTQLRSRKVEHFDELAVRVIKKHAESCDKCVSSRNANLAPLKLLAAVPVLAAPFMKQQVAAALSAAGVPVEGAAAGGSGETGGETGGQKRGRGRSTRLVRAAHFAAAIVVALVAVFVLASQVGDLGAPPAVTTSTTTTLAPTTTSPSTTIATSATTRPRVKVTSTTSTAPQTTTTTKITPNNPNNFNPNQNGP